MKIDAVTLEVFNHRFSAIAEEMGVRLGHTGFSPNIKERRDYSCALFDAAGRLVAQAAHIPVHLGSTPLSERQRFMVGDQRVLHLALVPRAASGSAAGFGEVSTDYVEVTVRYRLAAP